MRTALAPLGDTIGESSGGGGGGGRFVFKRITCLSITCDIDSKIISLSISHVHLFGTVPPEIGLLKNLVNLTLTANNLTGKLPIQMEIEDIDFNGRGRQRRDGSEGWGKRR
ncbi:hypothetical protein LguiA_029700 [Lonicera macranthoides]